jgi:PAS domain S-box-containing protein
MFESIILRSLVEYMPQRVYAKDLEGRFVFANQAVARGMGVDSPYELIGRTDSDFYPAENAAQYRREELEIMRSGRPLVDHEEDVCYSLTGTTAYLLTTKVPLRDERGQVVGIMGINQDITRRKEGEKALREAVQSMNHQLLSTLEGLRQSEEKYRAMYEHSLEGIYQVSLQGKMLNANPAMARILGYGSPDELVAELTDVQHQLYAHPQERESFLTSALQHGSLRREVELCRRDGGRIWASINARVVFDDGGQPALIEGFITDITEHKRAAAERQRREVAEAANRAKSSFLARMSHELRTPLNSIMGFAQLMLLEPGISERSLARLNAVFGSGQHLLALIDDVLDLAKIEAGKFELNPQDTSTQELLQLLTATGQVRTAEKNLAFMFMLPPDLPQHIRVDERRLRQVLLNLIGNAIKFTDRGHVALRVLVLDRQAHSARLRFEVEDTGIGIAEDKLEAVFQPFEQSGDVAQRTAGTGLGLAISRQLVRVMGGELEVRSQLGRGSVFGFEVSVPVVGAPVQRPAAQPLPVGYAGPKKAVLVVDDVAANRGLLRDLLLQMDFEVFEASDGSEALDTANEMRPDLILIDSVMPVMSGPNAIVRLREQPAFQRVPIISISASAFADDASRAMSAGANGFLTKPIDVNRLVDEIARHLNIRWAY